MDLSIDTSSSTPPFEQVRSQLAGQITQGTLPAGTKLPPVRRLAEELGLAANTVARAYRDLETAGLVETHGRGGTIVSSAGNPARERLRNAAERYASLVRDLGFDPAEGLAYIRSALGTPPRP